MMPRERSLFHNLKSISEISSHSIPLEEKVNILRTARSQGGGLDDNIDLFLCQEIERYKKGMEKLMEKHAKLKEIFDRMTAPPWHLAIFLQRVDVKEVPSALVSYDGRLCIVGLDEHVTLEDLRTGDEVYLNQERNAIMGRSVEKLWPCGDTAVFEQYLPEGRALIRKENDEEHVTKLSGRLQADCLERGDRVLWDRSIKLVTEKLPATENSAISDMFLETPPEDAFDQIGGLEEAKETIKRSIEIHCFHQDASQKYRLKKRGGILLIGKPGCGKTMMARALANYLGSISPSGKAKFASIKPAALHSSYYSQSEANYRALFTKAKELGRLHPEIPVILYFDELDSIGMARSSGNQFMHHIDERVLTAFASELDGLEERENVVVVGSTNRPDKLDSALMRPGRFGDLIIEVPRPNLEAARSIFKKHFKPDVPYASDGGDIPSDEIRDDIIEAALSTIFSPNGCGPIASIHFRDGMSRPIYSSDFISGAIIANIAETAAQEACYREIETGSEGIELKDVLDAIEDEMEKHLSFITPGNANAYIDNLPDDAHVTGIERVKRRAKKSHRLLNAV
ncbi:MAG: AAA family ATPase [Candidatus Omnitrophica bacterium]|nr:AAA family ATPase [Candidatus Omnitrophota bacterium]